MPVFDFGIGVSYMITFYFKSNFNFLRLKEAGYTFSDSLQYTCMAVRHTKLLTFTWPIKKLVYSTIITNHHSTNAFSR